VTGAKMLDDFFASNRYYAHMGGVDLQEFNCMELYFCFLIEWKLHVPGGEAMQLFLGK
jgi:hypothetical protein